MVSEAENKPNSQVSEMSVVAWRKILYKITDAANMLIKHIKPINLETCLYKKPVHCIKIHSPRLGKDLFDNPPKLAS